MDIGLIISFIFVFAMVGFALYLHSQKKANVDNFEPMYYQNQTEPVYDPTKFDISVSQHIGWLQSGHHFDNLNLYFDTTNASFFALSLHDNTNKIFLEIDMPQDGQTIQVNGRNYTVEFYKDEN